jgi:hypothetical protein
MMRLILIVVAAFSFIQLSCGNSGPPNPGNTPPNQPPASNDSSGGGGTTATIPLGVGHWGSNQADMVVTDSGATIQFGCASGAINQPILLNANGRFSLPGTYTPGGGPVRSDGGTHLSATYSGQVTGDSMLFTVRFNDGTQDQVSQFMLTRGVIGDFIRCL